MGNKLNVKIAEFVAFFNLVLKNVYNILWNISTALSPHIPKEIKATS